MVNIDKKMSEVLDKGLKTFPGTSDIYWDMGAIHTASVALINSMLREVIETIKTNHSLVFDTEQFMKENYEGIA